MLIEWMRTRIAESVLKLHEECGAERPGELKINVEQPVHLEHGDYSTNIAMQLAKTLRKPPLHIAGLLKSKLESNSDFSALARLIEVAPPGFLNMHINWNVWARGEFHSPAASPGGKAIIEHTSINPNKSAHIGHLRNSCIGDTLARILKKTGREVEVHNYIDDLGNQLADTVVGLLHVPLNKDHARFGDFCWDIYSGVNREYTADPVKLGERTNVLHALEEGGNGLSWIGLLVAERIVREHLEEMTAFGIDYDLLVWESQIVREGFWEAAFKLLKDTSSFEQEKYGKLEGCWVLRQSAAGTEETLTEEASEQQHQMDKVLVRSNGILTYTAKDIAYHLWKFGLLDKDFSYQPFSDGLWSTHHGGTTSSAYGKAETVINVIDYRQQYPQAMVKQALEVLGYTEQADKLRHVSYGVVSLSPAAAEELGIDVSSGKSSYAMSGRQGVGIKIADLLDRMEGIIDEKRSDATGLSSRMIGAAAIRYYLLRFALSTEVVFDLQQATEVTGNTGVYLMYAYARAANIMAKTAANGSSGPVFPAEAQPKENAELALIRHIASWQDTLHAAARELSPTIVCNYAYELASLFNNFYAACPILKADEDTRTYRLWLVSLFRQTMGEALDALGLPAPTRM
ncbi:arginine--tRNA ligase [Paenibacillus sp. 1011MAR3C5]|uniref:arginine--tRNA ligase n=1 Tax=Paenibacillus sp. 1011MAR3C5 TaxID=1675787 RepID=UPI000E6D1851|nr:arginine--tRNA ligase [Paenibacillus sp. 1011MAR3C5]RJE86195.1 arginine--tRNA ligase [Paenibacillus sp. 1011MAR3C5]